MQTRSSTRTQNVPVPASVHTTQPVVQNYYHEEQVNHVQTPYVRRYAVRNPVPVPVPVVKRKEVVRRIPVPVQNKKKDEGQKIVNRTIVNVHMPESESSSSEEGCGCGDSCWGRSSKCGGSWSTGAKMNKPARRVIYRRDWSTGSGFN